MLAYRVVFSKKLKYMRKNSSVFIVFEYLDTDEKELNLKV